MVSLHGACVVGVVDLNYLTAVEEADIITISRGYGIEAKPLLPPPYSNWLYLYDVDGKRCLDADGFAIRLPRG